jgi:hypothetical protein
MAGFEGLAETPPPPQTALLVMTVLSASLCGAGDPSPLRVIVFTLC